MRLALALILAASPAWAQNNCAPSPSAYEQLSEKWGESRTWAGLSNGTVFEVWTNLKTGTWTIINTTASGVSCILRSGLDSQEFSPVIGEPS